MRLLSKKKHSKTQQGNSDESFVQKKKRKGKTSRRVSKVSSLVYSQKAYPHHSYKKTKNKSKGPKGSRKFSRQNKYISSDQGLPIADDVTVYSQYETSVDFSDSDKNDLSAARSTRDGGVTPGGMEMKQWLQWRISVNEKVAVHVLNEKQLGNESLPISEFQDSLVNKNVSSLMAKVYTTSRESTSLDKMSFMIYGIPRVSLKLPPGDTTERDESIKKDIKQLTLKGPFYDGLNRNLSVIRDYYRGINKTKENSRPVSPQQKKSITPLKSQKTNFEEGKDRGNKEHTPKQHAKLYKKATDSDFNQKPKYNKKSTTKPAPPPTLHIRPMFPSPTALDVLPTKSFASPRFLSKDITPMGTRRIWTPSAYHK